MSRYRCRADTSGYVVRLASTRIEIEAAAALRRAVFCKEQGLFAGDDRDGIDAHAMPIVVLAPTGQIVGTVRIHQEAPRQWWGSRLAVARDHRRIGQLGAGLIRCAVSTANAHGCDRFLAHVQAQNERLFRKLHWESLAYEDHHGVPHVKMQADLAAYPAGMDPLPEFKPGAVAA